MIRKNEIAFACGMKGSGKSRWLDDCFVVRFPRVLLLDTNGEYIEQPDVYAAAGWSALIEALDAVADHRKFPSWRIAAALDEAETVRLFQLFAPTDNFGADSLARMLGGVAFVSGECDVIAPNGRTPAPIKSGWKRGRHVNLSLLMGTQRAAECDRIVTSQSDVVACFTQSESRDLQWIADRLGNYAADDVAALPLHWCVTSRVTEPFYSVLDPNRRVTKRAKRLDGKPL